MIKLKSVLILSRATRIFFILAVAATLYIFFSNQLVKFLVPSVTVLEPPPSSFMVEMEYQPHQSTIFKVHVTRCLKGIIVNGVALPSNKTQACGEEGTKFKVNLERYLHPGKNIIFFGIDEKPKKKVKTNTPISVSFNPQYGALNFEFFPGVLLVIFTLSGIAFYLLRRKILDPATLMLISLAVAASCIVINNTGYLAFSNDVGGHIEYIQYLYNNLALPHPYKGWQYYHPPLYYLLNLPFYALANEIGMPDTETYLQYVSICFYLIFLIFAALTLRSLISYNAAYYIALLMLLVWPIGLPMMGKINNDILSYPLGAIVLYSLLRWNQHTQFRWIAYAIVAATLAIAVKTSGYVLCAIVGIFILYRIIKKEVPLRYFINKYALLFLLVFALTVTANTGRLLYYRMIDNSQSTFLIGNIRDDNFDKGWVGDHRIQNTWEGYLWFNYNMFVTEPFFSHVSDSYGRQYFWNSLAKTLLYGEYTWHSKMLASCISFSFLCVIIFTFINFAWLHPRLSTAEKRNYMILFLFLLVQAAALMYARLSVPIAGTAQGRYIYPIIIAIVALFGKTLCVLKSQGSIASKVMVMIGEMIAMGFVVCAIWFLLNQFAEQPILQLIRYIYL